MVSVSIAAALLTLSHGLPSYTPELRDELWKQAQHEAKEAGSNSQHVCGYGTWGDSGQLNQWDAGFSPCWPSTLNIAATWDEELMARWSVEMAREFGEPNRGQLGPGVNLARYAWNGRLGEYMSGEDPYLGSKMIASQVSAYRKIDRPAVQTVKHFIPNTIEKDRNGMTEVVDERTLFEVYYPPFEAAVDAGVSAVMCSYNLVKCTSGKCNGTRAYACANDDILNKHLKEAMGFKGMVISDWDATKCQPESKGSGGCTPGSYVDNDFAADAGLDLEMPACMSFAGGVTKRAHEKEARLRWAYLVQGRDVRGMPLKGPLRYNSTEKHDRRLAAEAGNSFCCWWPKESDCGSCSSKDRDATRDHCVAAKATWCHGGGAADSESAGQKKQEPDSQSATHKNNQNQDWQSGIYKDNPFGSSASTAPTEKKEQTHVELYGKKVEMCPHLGKDNYKAPCKLDLAARIIAESTVLLKNDGGVLPLSKSAKVALAGDQACSSHPTAQGGGSGWNGMACNQVPKVNVKQGIAGLSGAHPQLSCPDQGGDNDATKDADVIVVVVAPEKASEGRDRSTLQLFPKDVELIKKYAEAGKKVVVVMDAPGPMITSTWDQHVAAIVVSWLPGQQNGRGIAMALYGDKFEPSGRLPVTFPKCSTSECTKQDELDSVQFGNQVENKKDRIYSEKALIGYRWYHAKGIEVSYPFGYGLFAYGSAEMTYSDAAVTPHGSGVTVTCQLQHSGPRAGHDVPQLYLSFPDSVPGDANAKPEWVLKGFTKTFVKPKEAAKVSLSLTERDLSYFDDAPGKSYWICAKGTFRVCVGANARDAVNPKKGSCTTFVSNCLAEADKMLVAKKNDAVVPVQIEAARIQTPTLVVMIAAVAILIGASVIALQRRIGHNSGGTDVEAKLRKESTRLLFLEEQVAPVSEENIE